MFQTGQRDRESNFDNICQSSVSCAFQIVFTEDL